MTVAAVALGVVAASAPAQHPRCYGAASRDPEQRCSNPALRYRVTPSPAHALLQPEGACDPWNHVDVVCRFGTPPEVASGTIALLGDSHARAYRVAVAAVADAHDFSAWSVTKPGCGFSFAKPDLPEPQSSDCVDFSHEIVRFVGDRPAITTVFVAENSAVKVVPEPSRGDPEELRIQGYVDAWDGLPASVTRVIVLRDPFRQRPSTPDCVAKAHRHHRNAGIVCALSRAPSLAPDPAAIAAWRPHRAGLTVNLVDFTPFMCGARRCFPVVGGVLVHKDIDHITQAFSATLGPFLLRTFDRLTAT